MADGIWSGTPAGENPQQAGLTRHRILRVDTGTDLTVAWRDGDSSGLASLDPNTIPANTHNVVTDRGPEGGPHFVMSKDTPDGSHSYGFEFVLFLEGIIAGQQAAAGVGGYTVTPWVLIANTQSIRGTFTPVWAAFAAQTGVNVREIYHTFDINATMIRFQIGNLALDPTANNRSINIAFAEL